ncbi:unnamed protein product [Cuscuta campestris]|uniref:Uncharacterized protein n=2 Tax=Cuscuta sect. Cleistogrammica TaxID=1824901 RepID=A0A484N707_9ASTE|nr:unnamed protein product [Cuscuta campestris]
MMGRPPCCDKANVKKGSWTPEEDAKILAYVASHGTGNWTLVPQKAGLNRCGKSCRLRYTNYLRPDLKHDSFTPEEEASIIELHKTVGSRWSLIARHLPGRTDNDVKNYWNTKLKKKLKNMGIDPLTHKPFAQVFAEFGRLSSGLPLLNNTPAIKTESLFDPSEPTDVSNQHTYFVGPEMNAQFQLYPLSIQPDDGNFTPFHSPSPYEQFPAPISSSSSSSSSLAPWNEFILQDPETEVQRQEDDTNDDLPEKCEDNNGQTFANEDSFVENMLARDREMQLEFPQLLDDGYFD